MCDGGEEKAITAGLTACLLPQIPAAAWPCENFVERDGGHKDCLLFLDPTWKAFSSFICRPPGWQDQVKNNTCIMRTHDSWVLSCSERLRREPGARTGKDMPCIWNWHCPPPNSSGRCSRKTLPVPIQDNFARGPSHTQQKLNLYLEKETATRWCNTPHGNVWCVC